MIRYWEVLNEPDRGWDYRGTATDYAWTLRHTYDAIKSVAPEDQVLAGGITSPRSLGWLSRVFATPGTDALRRFDIANVHLRGTLGSLSRAMAQFRAFSPTTASAARSGSQSTAIPATLASSAIRTTAEASRLRRATSAGPSPPCCAQGPGRSSSPCATASRRNSATAIRLRRR